MIADELPNRPHIAAPSSPVCSRRAFLVLAVCGFVAACAPSRASSSSGPTTTPAPLMPAAPLTVANAGHLIQLAVFAPRDGRLRGAAWSADGRTLATSGNGIHLWDVVTGRQRLVWGGNGEQVYALAWSAAAGLLASASADGSARIWDSSSGSALHTLPNPSRAPVMSVAWSPDGARLVMGTWQGTVELWDGQSGQHLATWAGPPEESVSGHAQNPYAVWGVAWTPDGHSVVSTRYDGHVLVWDAVSGRLRASLTPDSQPNGVAWRPDGGGFASSDDRGTIQLWDAQASGSYANARTLQAREGTGWTFPLVWTADGTLLACATEVGLVLLWDMRAGTELAPLQAHQAPVWGLALSPDGSRLATASDDGTARLWGVTNPA